MKHPSIRIEGPILSTDIVDQIAEGEYAGQAPADFGIDGRVRDEISRGWADARALWSVFSHQRERSPADDRLGTTRTRTTWILPFLSLLGYELEYLREAAEIGGKKYPISHRATNRGDMPVHVIGFTQSMDAREDRLMSAHSLAQEYLNLADDKLYALVTNGLQLRLLRDASRLVRLSYVEFDLQRMMEEELYSDFAVLFRLLHASRMPASSEDAAGCILEAYHQDAMENGERIRGGLSSAVERSLELLAAGFLSAPENEELRRTVLEGDAAVQDMYHNLLVLVYRLLFLLVIEERDLVFLQKADPRRRDIYYNYYSASRLRRLAEIARPEDGRNADLWELLRNTFRLFEEEDKGDPLGISALGGDLFSPTALGQLAACAISNEHLVACLSSLDRFDDHETHQTIKVNYGALNVEEFGSVYEGLLEKDPVVIQIEGKPHFSFKAGEGRSSSGSHYTPEELTHPLIRHSLDHIISSRLKQNDPEKALLSIRVCDPACGSGHILLNAARRIGLELARVRSGVEQPSPPDIRQAVRDAIRHCIYGVDKNPHAVELCKVALWLESHDPGEPLGFLDHHIKCGDSVVGIARREELLEGIPDEAFKRQPGDDATASSFAKRNRKERETRGQIALDLDEATRDKLDAIRRGLLTVDGMSEHGLEEIDQKRLAYENLVSQSEWIRLRDLADMLTAQFFIPKTDQNQSVLATDGGYLQYVAGGSGRLYEARVEAACRIAREKRFFHWFIEFPDVFEEGGFDCILGNPPFLGGLRISASHGGRYLHYLQSQYAPARSTCDLVAYFFRRNYSLIKDGAYFGLIATNTIAQGDTREGSLEPIAQQGGEIVFATRSMRWPGLAAVSVSLIAMHKGKWNAPRFLDGREVHRITPYLDDSEVVGKPYRLNENAGKSFQGSIVLGMGFVLEPTEAQALIAKDPKNKDVLFPFLNGEDLNSRPDQSPSRWVINFFDWPEDAARKYPECFSIVEEKARPERLKIKDKFGRENWWRFLRHRPELAEAIASLEKVMVCALVSKYIMPFFADSKIVFMNKLCVFPFDTYPFYCLLQSSFHDCWTWKYSSTMREGWINYAPSDCFETFPFPDCLRGHSTADTSSLESIGREYYEHRQALMLDIQLGLTKTYNLFHDPGIVAGATDLSALESQLKKSGAKVGAVESVDRIQNLRDLHVRMDAAVLAAYGWAGLVLGHDFHAVDFLPENDRMRFTISPQARREVLKRLLELNHRYHSEQEASPVKPRNARKGMSSKGNLPELSWNG